MQIDEKTFRDLKTRSEGGDAKAQFELGEIYSSVLSPITDYKESFELAMKLYEKAAAQEHVDAQFALGSLLEGAVLLKPEADLGKPNQEAIFWFKKAASHGHAEAQYRLGKSYYSDGVSSGEETREAEYWLVRAAEQGNKDAQYNLGLLRDDGSGDPEKNWNAFDWYVEAAKQGHEEAKLKVDCFFGDDELSQLKKSALLGDVAAKYDMGYAYYSGEGVPQDFDVAQKWFQRAADGGSIEAQFNMGILSHLSNEYEEAFECWSKAASEGYSRAQFNLALLYNKGFGVCQDRKAAYTWAYIADSNQNGKPPNMKSNHCDFEDGLTDEQIQEAKESAKKMINDKPVLLDEDSRKGIVMRDYKGEEYIAKKLPNGIYPRNWSG